MSTGLREPIEPVIFGQFPNIPGRFSAFGNDQSAISNHGAFTVRNTLENNLAGSADSYIERNNDFWFNASDGNSIYSPNCSTVQVDALFGLSLIKAF